MKIGKVPPIKVGQVIRMGITGIGSKGNPYGRVQGFVVFLNDYENKSIMINQLISIKITRVLEKFAFGELVEEDD